MKIHFKRNPAQKVVGLVTITDQGLTKELCAGAEFNEHQAQLVRLAIEKAYYEGRASFHQDVTNLLKKSGS